VEHPGAVAVWSNNCTVDITPCSTTHPCASNSSCSSNSLTSTCRFLLCSRISWFGFLSAAAGAGALSLKRGTGARRRLNLLALTCPLVPVPRGVKIPACMRTGRVLPVGAAACCCCSALPQTVPRQRANHLHDDMCLSTLTYAVVHRPGP
jgi:hypothetical protein